MEYNIQHMIIGIGAVLAVLVPALSIWAHARLRKQTRETIRDYRSSIRK